MKKAEFYALVEDCQKAGCMPGGNRDCLLCGTTAAPGEQVFIGLFLPRAQKRFGAPSGKTRGIMYLLCAACYSLPDSIDHVEEIIFRNATVE